MTDLEQLMDNFEELGRFRQWLNLDRVHDEFFFLEMQVAIGQKMQDILQEKKEKKFLQRLEMEERAAKDKECGR